jgi:hypothetical protein
MLRFISPAIVLFAAVAPSQQAAVQIFGTACNTAEGPASMRVNGLPVLGQSFDFVYAGPNHFTDHAQRMVQPMLVLGGSLAGPVVIPQWLLAEQPPGCELLPAVDILQPMPFPDPLQFPYATTFPDTWTMNVPNDPTLLGTAFFGQWLAVQIQCGFSGCEPLPLWVGTSETAVCGMGL